MNEYEAHEVILKQVCSEIQSIAEQVKKNGSMSEQEAKRLDLLYHIKKSMLTCYGMEHPEEYFEGNSGMRGRSPSTGRYVSRDAQNSYDAGFSQGYTAAMNQNGGGNSGHMPMQNPYYPEPRRW